MSLHNATPRFPFRSALLPPAVGPRSLRPSIADLDYDPVAKVIQLWRIMG
jgi:hypothetical protein